MLHLRSASPPPETALIIELTDYLERRRRTAETRAAQLASVSGMGRRTARGSATVIPARRPSVTSVRWSSFLPIFPAIELAALYAEASLI